MSPYVWIKGPEQTLVFLYRCFSYGMFDLLKRDTCVGRVIGRAKVMIKDTLLRRIFERIRRISAEILAPQSQSQLWAEITIMEMAKIWKATTVIDVNALSVYWYFRVLLTSVPDFCRKIDWGDSPHYIENSKSYHPHSSIVLSRYRINRLSQVPSNLSAFDRSYFHVFCAVALTNKYSRFFSTLFGIEIIK